MDAGHLAMRRLRPAARLAAVSATLVLAGLALAQPQEKQEPAKEDEGEEQIPQIEIPDLTGRSSDQEEMIRLFHEVERTLESIDVELADAGAGRIPLPEGRDSAIDRLLQSHGQKSEQAVSGIEQILEVAQRMGGKSGGT
jgi:GTP cyclohydrolase III